MARSWSSFEFFLRSAKPLLILDYGELAGNVIIGRTRAEYEGLSLQVPDIGGRRNVFQPVMAVNACLVALYRAMSIRGEPPQAAVRIFQQIFEGWLKKLPTFLLNSIGRLMLWAPLRLYFEAQARRSQKRLYPEDFVWRVERTPVGEFSLVFEECAVNKWYEALGVLELKPYCNFVDVTYSRLMGMGVDAAETIGVGCERCALRFKYGRETIVPPNLSRIISSDTSR